MRLRSKRTSQCPAIYICLSVRPSVRLSLKRVDCTLWRKRKFDQLENVAIENALQLEAARHRAVPIRFNLFSSPVPSLNSLSLSVAVLERFYCWYVTLRCDLELWPRDLDILPLTLNIRSRWASPRSNSVRNLSKIGQSAADWPYDLEHCITCCAML